MTLLEHWQQKTSWKKTLPIYQIPYSLRTGETDLDLARLCSLEPELTLSKENGFEQFGYTTYRENIRPEWKHLLGKIVPLKYSEKWFIKNLQKRFEQYIIENWDSNKFHLVTAGGGLDSRWMGWTLKKLEKELGKDWLGDIHFRCQGIEGEWFKPAWKRMGWNPDQYSVYKEDNLDAPDYFPIPDFKTNINAFTHPSITFWEDILTLEDQKKSVLMHGGVGGIYFSYPVFSKDAPITDYRLDDVMAHSGGAQRKMLKNFLVWDDLLMPFCGYEYMELAMKVPQKYIYRVTTRHGQDRDNIRLKLLAQFNDDGPFYIGHKYNYKFSKQRVQQIKSDYLNSHFYKDFSHFRWIRKSKPWKFYAKGRINGITHSLDLKLYSLATVYEGVQLWKHCNFPVDSAGC